MGDNRAIEADEEYALRSLIVFAGAGASRGISSEKYPMAIDFKKRLPSEITSNHLYLQLLHHLSTQGQDEAGVDIEHVLWELGRLDDAIAEITAPERLASYLLTSNQINIIAQSQNHGPNFHAQLLALKAASAKLQDDINERVYELYSQPPRATELERSWLPLLRSSRVASFDRVDIVTTNYDVVIESALISMGDARVRMGLSQDLFPGVDLSAWRASDPSVGLLTKLHGSVDWKLGNGGTKSDPVIRRGHPEFDGDHKKRLILYPGFKGIPTREPFLAFHDYFRSRLRECSHVLFIGFAFRDQFINEIIVNNLQPACRIAVVNPAEKLPDHAFLQDAIHIRKGFGIPVNALMHPVDGMSAATEEEMTAWMQ